MKAGVLYISYSGMLEPLGQSQVLAYQERLSANRPIHLISFERAADWADAEHRAAIAMRMSDAGIQWHPLRYHKRLSVLATMWDIVCGSVLGWRLVLKHELRIIHARSYVPSVMALAIKKLTGAKFVFDMRGLWVDERVDGGLWPRGGVRFRLGKWFERQFLTSADHLVALTRATLSEIEGWHFLRGGMPPASVIPTCADLARFRPLSPPKGPLVFGYVGSVGTWYMFDEVLVAFRHLLVAQPHSRLLVVNRNDHDYVRTRLRTVGVPPESVEVRSATYDEIPAQINRMHAGVFFYRPSYSRVACSPTKLGELLGCGVPCLSNDGVGDMAHILEGENVGVIVSDFESETIRAGVTRLLGLLSDGSIRARCRESAKANFSLEEGVLRYQAAYDSLESSK